MIHSFPSKTLALFSSLYYQRKRIMNEIQTSSSPPAPPTASSTTTTTTASKSKSKREMSVMSRVKEGCLSFTVSLQESFRYIKALFVGQTKKITARNEKEVTAAELQAQKMQVEATNEAENIKKRLDKSL